MPALAICVLFTAIAISAIDPNPKSTLLTGIHALFGLSNLYLYHLSIDYFAPAARSNAFTQTWSLGVEEQFYLVFPALFWFATKGRSENSNRTLTVPILVVSVLSFGFFVKLFPSHPSLTYFFTPLRFWELGTGCLLAAARQSLPVRWLSQASDRLGLLRLVLLLSCFWIPATHLVISTGAVVLLTGLLLVGTNVSSWAQRVLTTPTLRHVGLISYSLYLWHWSVLVIARWSVGVNQSNVIWLLVLMFLLAEISYRWVETPWRNGLVRWPVASALAGLALTTAVLSTLVVQHEYLLLPVDAKVQNAPPFLPVKGEGFNPGCVVDGAQRKLGANTFSLCTFPPRTLNGQTIWLMGDSHAGHLQGLLYRLHDSEGLGVHLIETPGRPYPYSGTVFEPRERIVEKVYEQARPGDVMLVSRLFLDRGSSLPAADLVTWAAELKVLAKQLAARQMSLVVVGPPPMFDFEDVVVCLRSVFASASCELDRNGLAKSVGQVEGLLEQQLSGEPNAHVFSSFSVLCPPTLAQCSPVINGAMTYRDRDHLNSAGAALLAEPMNNFLLQNNVLKPSLGAQ